MLLQLVYAKMEHRFASVTLPVFLNTALEKLGGHI